MGIRLVYILVYQAKIRSFKLSQHLDRGIVWTEKSTRISPRIFMRLNPTVHVAVIDFISDLYFNIV